MIKPLQANTVLNSLPRTASGSEPPSADVPAPSPPEDQRPDPDPVLCGHCGRTASNGLVCIGMCVADSGY